MRTIRTAVPVAGAVAVLALAACGGATGGAGASAPDGARLVPASAPVFVSLNTDFGSQEWQAVDALLARFPSGGKLLDRLTSSLAQGGVDLESDLKPALGPETDVALLDLPAQGDPTVVLLTKPADPAKLEALLAKSDKPPVWRIVDGWYVVADSQAIIDRALAGADQAALADDGSFSDALGSLSGSPVARVYVNGPSFTEALQKSVARGGAQMPFNLGSLGVGGELRSVAVGLSAEGQGVRVEGVARTQGAPDVKEHAATLASLVPADALAFVSFDDLQTGLKQLYSTIGQQSPQFDSGLSQLEQVLGVSVEDDLLPLFAGEGALYVRAGAPIPEVTLVLTPADPTKALATLDKLTAGIGAFAGLAGGSAPFTTSTESIAGVTAKKLSFGKVDVYYAVVKDHVVVTTAVKGIADLVAGSGSLADDPRFQEAKRAAGLPDESMGFVYLDLAGGLDALETAGVLSGASQETLANLQPLQYVVLYATGGKDETRFAGFLGIK